MSTTPLPEAALAALRDGRNVEAVGIVRERLGVSLAEANQLVQRSLEIDPQSSGDRRTYGEAIGDYLAGSYKFPLAAGLGAGATSLWMVGEFFPQLGKGIDPGVMILVAMGIPLVVVAVLLMVWARRWRARRAAPPASGMTSSPAISPGAPWMTGANAGASRDSGLPAEASAALDRDDSIMAIKAVRSARGLGLAEAKAVVDAAIAARRARNPT
ncbi:MAG: hypothetical protein JNM79_16435 [Burkholderiales bacterium]|nr:hypothetical protein [Burkholderiales bacterium]